jgi:hypothetical protein
MRARSAYTRADVSQIYQTATQIRAIALGPSHTLAAAAQRRLEDCQQVGAGLILPRITVVRFSDGRCYGVVQMFVAQCGRGCWGGQKLMASRFLTPSSAGGSR